LAGLGLGPHQIVGGGPGFLADPHQSHPHFVSLPQTLNLERRGVDLAGVLDRPHYLDNMSLQSHFPIVMGGFPVGMTDLGLVTIPNLRL
jgi:hypothetical protein